MLNAYPDYSLANAFNRPVTCRAWLTSHNGGNGGNGG